MIGRLNRMVLRNLRIVGREEEVRLFLADRFPGAIVITGAELCGSRVVVEVQTSNIEESAEPDTTRDLQAVISESISLES